MPKRHPACRGGSRDFALLTLAEQVAERQGRVPSKMGAGTTLRIQFNANLSVVVQKRWNHPDERGGV